jgi:hypothetical protein
MSDATGGSTPEELLSGLDRARPLPPGLRGRLEDELVAASSRPRALEPDLAAALTEALSRPTFEEVEAAELLSGLDGTRALPEALAAGLTDRLEAGVARWRFRTVPRRWVGAGVAAAMLLAAGVTGVELQHTSQVRSTAGSASRASAPTSAALAPQSATGAGTGGIASSSGVNGPAVPAAGSGTSAGMPAAGGSTNAAAPNFGSSATVPRIGSVSPVSGGTAGGNIVVIRGSGFTGTTAVRFGSVRSARVVFVSDLEIRAVVPAHGPGTVSVVVVTLYGTSTAGPGSRYTFTG